MFVSLEFVHLFPAMLMFLRLSETNNALQLLVFFFFFLSFSSRIWDFGLRTSEFPIFKNLAIWRIQAVRSAFFKLSMQELIQELISPFL